MIPDGSYTAVLDRFESKDAVLEVSGETDRYELVVDQHELPQPSRHVDAVLSIEIVDGELASADYEPEETERRKQQAQSRFDRLSSRPPDETE
jgi:hypothetical protein